MGYVCEQFILFVYIELLERGFADGSDAHSVFPSAFVCLNVYRPKRARVSENGLCATQALYLSAGSVLIPDTTKLELQRETQPLP